MMTDGGVIKIMDFGIAHAHDSLGLTNAGAMVGTPAYMAPEQVLGQPIDARTDLYAMGVVLFRLVTAAFPFKGETPFEMTQSQVNDAPARATDVRPDLPAWVDEILTRALAKQPADRFQSASEFQAALANAIAIETPNPVATAAVEKTEVMVRPEIRPEMRSAPAVPAFRLTATWLTAAAVAVLAAGTWFMTSGASPARAPEPAPSSPVQIATVEPPAAMPVSTLPVASTRKPAPRPVPSPTAEVPARAPVSFTGAKMIAVNGSRTSTSDVVLLLSDTEVSIRSQDDSGAPTVLPYRAIVKATYAQGRDPKWDAGLSGPGGRVDVPGIGILSRTRHWLVLQGSDNYVILRLDGVDRADVMRAFEERAGIAIDRATGVK
jgi:serine/threonine-protein kinase